MKTADISVQLLDHMGSDLSVVNAARVSFDKESDWEYEDPSYKSSAPWVAKWLNDKDTKLINYLAKHKHTSPFNHCFASFRVKAPIFVARQLVKHKFLPWNEVSRRYVDSEPEFYIPTMWRKRAENVKQGSSEDPVDQKYFMVYLGDGIELTQYGVMDTVFTLYEALLQAGVCPEQARMVLPQNTMTEWVWSGSLGAWADMCRLRLDSHAQKETREVAEKIAASLKEIYPVSFAALIEN